MQSFKTEKFDGYKNPKRDFSSRKNTGVNFSNTMSLYQAVCLNKKKEKAKKGF